MNTDISKLEKIVITALLTLVTVLVIMMMFKTTDPEIKVTPEQDNTKLELEIENLKLQILIDSLKTSDSLHLVMLKEKQTIIKYKQNEITKVIDFIPNANSKFKDSLWAVHLQDTIWRDSIR